jgi:hypothetical protein
MTTVVFGTVTTILETGISFPTLVERRGKAQHDSTAREFCSEGQTHNETGKVILPQETNSVIGR